MEKVDTAYEYFTQEGLPGYFSRRTHYENQCDFVRIFWKIGTNYYSESTKEKSRAKE